MLCLAIVGIGLCIRLGAALVWQARIDEPTMLKFGDSDTYWYLAKTIAHGEAYQYGSPNSKIFRAPIYPIFLAPAASLLPHGERYTWWSILMARWSGCLAGAVAIYLVIVLTILVVRGCQPATGLHRVMRVEEHLSALAAAGFAVLYPGAIGMSIFVLSEAIFCPLLLATLLLTYRSIACSETERHAQARWWMLGAGIMSGLACLARPSWSLWPVFLAIYLAWNTWRWKPNTDVEHPQSVHRRFANWFLLCILFGIGISTAMAPWWVRNYWITKRFVPTTLQVGASLYDGWHPGATGSSDENMEFVLAFAEAQSQEDLAIEKDGKTLESTYEYRLNRRLFQAAWEWAAANPSDAVRLGLVKLGKTWSPFPVAREIGGAGVKWMEAIGYLTIVSFSLIGLWKARTIKGAWLPALPCLYFAVLHMFFIGSVRYRQPAILVLCCLAGIGFATVWTWMVRRDDTNNNFDGSKVVTDAQPEGTR
jgi:hypothetical protein